MRFVSVLDAAKAAYSNGCYEACIEALSKLPENTIEDKLLIWANTYLAHLANGDFELAARYAKRVNEHDSKFFERIGERSVTYQFEKKHREILSEKEIDELLKAIPEILG